MGLVNCLSRSLPSEAPVTSVILNGARLARSASAIGTALASPARVKPLMPTIMPSQMWDAASSGLTTFRGDWRDGYGQGAWQRPVGGGPVVRVTGARSTRGANP